MAGHRSPRGRRAHRPAEHVPARHHAAHAPVPTGPSLRTTVIASAAAVGAVTTGTFTAFIPTSDDSVTPTAAAEGLLDATLAANSTALRTAPATSSAAFLPVSVATDDADGFATADQHLARLDKAADLAAQLAEQHAQEQRKLAERAQIDALINSGGLDGWIAEALDAMDMPQSFAPGIKKIIMAESNGNPRAINNWDANARRGTPSQGLMQTIPSTFRKFVLPAYADRPITDPVANITAGVRYMIATYGVGTLKAGGRSDSSGDYLGY